MGQNIMNWSEAVESRFVQNEPNFLTSSQSVGCKIPLVAGVEFVDENGDGPGLRLRTAKVEAVRTGAAVFAKRTQFSWRDRSGRFERTWSSRGSRSSKNGRAFGRSTSQVTQERRGHEGIVDLRNIAVFRSGHCAGPQLVLQKL